MFTNIYFITTSVCITATPFSHSYCRYYVSVIIKLIDNYTVVLFRDTYNSILAWYPSTMQSCNISLQCHPIKPTTVKFNLSYQTPNRTVMWTHHCKNTPPATTAPCILTQIIPDNTAMLLLTIDRC